MPFLIPGANYDAGKVFADVSMRQQALAQQQEQAQQAVAMQAMQQRAAAQRAQEQMDMRRRELERQSLEADRAFAAQQEAQQYSRGMGERKFQYEQQTGERDFGLRQQQLEQQKLLTGETIAERREGKVRQAEIERERIESQRKAGEEVKADKERKYKAAQINAQIAANQRRMQMVAAANDANDPEVARQLDELDAANESLRKQALDAEHGKAADSEMEAALGPAPAGNVQGLGVDNMPAQPRQPGVYEKAAISNRKKYLEEQEAKKEKAADDKLKGAATKYRNEITRATPDKARALADSLVASGELPEDRRDVFLQNNPTIKKIDELRANMENSDDPIAFVDDIARTLSEPDQRDEKGKLLKKSTRTELKEAGIDPDSILRELQGEAKRVSQSAAAPTGPVARPMDRSAEVAELTKKRMGYRNFLPSALELAGQYIGDESYGMAIMPYAGTTRQIIGPALQSAGRGLRSALTSDEIASPGTGAALQRFISDPNFRQNILRLLMR